MRTILVAIALLLSFGLIGCTEQSSGTQSEKKGDNTVKSLDGDGSQVAKKDGGLKSLDGDGSQVAKKDDGGKHDGWWCDEHGLPEKECWACSDKFCQKCKKTGDWCEKHERPQSQCFKCDPKLKAEWAKKYEARFGKKPPAFEDY